MLDGSALLTYLQVMKGRCGLRTVGSMLSKRREQMEQGGQHVASQTTRPTGSNACRLSHLS